MTLYKIDLKSRPDPKGQITIFHRTYHIQARFKQDAVDKAKKLWRDSLPEPETVTVEIDVLTLP